IICSPMTSLKTSIKTITYLSDIGCLEIQGASLISIVDGIGCVTIPSLSGMPEENTNDRLCKGNALKLSLFHAE
ncbi:hypothetical protein ACRWYG_24870, partial [Escherichia coli]